LSLTKLVIIIYCSALPLGQPGDHAKINVNSVHITPDPPKRGASLTITGVFTLGTYSFSL